MINFMILFLGLFWLQETVQAQDFQPPVQENAFSELLRLEEKLLPELDAFVAKKEDYLKELHKIIHQMEILKKPSNKSVQSFLGTPLNQYFLIKRFIDNWGTLDDYLQSDTSTHDLLSQIKLKKDAIPAKAKLNERLRVLEDTHNIDPEGYRVSL
nr:prolyl 4-hydroxylase subunit alpha-1-like [Pocillopora verrucosa]